VQTSSRAIGQIYVPLVNWILLAAVVLAVVGFGSSSRLASAYGVAVMGTMLTTTVLTFFVIRHGWHFPLWLCLGATGLFLVIDAAFFGAVVTKIAEGGWFPLLTGALVFGVMLTWRRGRARLMTELRSSSIPLAPFLDSVFLSPPHRVAGTAVFLSSAPDATPHALMHSLKHYKVLHQTNVFLTAEFHDVPWIAFEDRVRCERLGHDCWRMTVRYGFMNRPDVGTALELAKPLGLDVEPMDVSYFLSREKIVPSALPRGALARWRDRLFAAMARNAGSATDFFNIPANRVVELGTRVEI
jgi:KUP system potassium uptake protein